MEYEIVLNEALANINKTLKDLPKEYLELLNISIMKPQLISLDLAEVDRLLSLGGNISYKEIGLEEAKALEGSFQSKGVIFMFETNQFFNLREGIDLVEKLSGSAEYTFSVISDENIKEQRIKAILIE